jgi:PKD repeat protein
MDDGVYTVTLTVTDDDGGVGQDSLEAIVLDLAPMAEFNWSPEPQDEGNPIQFNDLSTSFPDKIVYWSWNFAGLGSSADQNPTFAFTNDGVYTVTLTVTDDDGSTDTVSHDLTVVDLSPTAAFTWSPEPQNEGSPIQFTDLSTSYPDTIVSWSWDFAGLGTSTLQNPEFTFMDDGVYTVTLTVTDHDGSIDMISHDVTVSTSSLSATLIVEKKIEWGIDSQYVNHPVFEITLGPQIQFWLGHGESQTFELEVGTYSISEETSGWSTRVLVHGGGYDYEIEGSSVDVKIEEGETITVTFVNRPPDFVIPETLLGTIASLVIMFIIYLLQNKRLLFKTQ